MSCPEYVRFRALTNGLDEVKDLLLFNERVGVTTN